MSQAIQMINIFLLALMWAPTFALGKFMLNFLDPISTTMLRCFFAFLFLLILTIASRCNVKISMKDLGHISFMGLVGAAIPFTACSAGMIHVQSSVAGILEGTVPLWTVILATILFKIENLNRWKIWGVIIGFIGTIILFLPTDGSSLTSYLQEGSGLTGKAYILGMALAFALSFLYAKKYLGHLPPLVVVTYQMIVATLILFPFSLSIPEIKLALTNNTPAVLTLFSLSILCTAMPWGFYYMLCRYMPATKLSFATYLCPPLATLIGYFFLQEIITFNLLWGSIIIVFALLISSYQTQKERYPKAS